MTESSRARRSPVLFFFSSRRRHTRCLRLEFRRVLFRSGFNPEFTGRENVFLNASLLGLSKKQTDARFDEIAGFAEIGEFIEQPVKTYSSGMVIRLEIGRASCRERGGADRDAGCAEQEQE